jgi:hypothetical protein
MALDFSVNKMNIKAITTTLVIAALTGSVIELATCESASAQDRGARFTFAPNTFAPGQNQRHRHLQSAWVPAPQMHQVSHGAVPKGNFFQIPTIQKPVQQPIIAQTAVTPQIRFNDAFGQPVTPTTMAPKGLSASPKQLPAFSPASKNVSARMASKPASKRVIRSAPRRTPRPAVAAAPASYGNKYFKPGSFVNSYQKMSTSSNVSGTIINKKH